jgi:serine phosphatase RsbU (regulator of sigma subunit)
LISSIVITLVYTNNLSKDILSLNKKIQTYTAEEFTRLPKKLYGIRTLEIVEIEKVIDKMALELDSYINSFKLKVEERTFEINKQNQLLELKTYEIQRQRDTLIMQKNLLENQKKLLADQHLNLIDSLHCAQQIQEALLPSLEEIRSYFAGISVYYRPRDVVSGDFYWAEKIKISNVQQQQTQFSHMNVLFESETEYEFNELFREQEAILFAVADCTGHGVPGAFMTIMGHNQISKIVAEHDLNDPGQILQTLNNELGYSLKGGKKIRPYLSHGMEITFCKFIPEEQILYYSSANSKAIIIRNGEIIKLKSSMYSIGGINTSAPFVTEQFKIVKGDVLYLYSDGYQDQFKRIALCNSQVI